MAESLGARPVPLDTLTDLDGHPGYLVCAPCRERLLALRARMRPELGPRFELELNPGAEPAAVAKVRDGLAKLLKDWHSEGGDVWTPPRRRA
jgi:hypothetical protein